jgi:hypothetical protein
MTKKRPGRVSWAQAAPELEMRIETLPGSRRRVPLNALQESLNGKPAAGLECRVDRCILRPKPTLPRAVEEADPTPPEPHYTRLLMNRSKYMIRAPRMLVRIPPEDTPRAISKATTPNATTSTTRPAFFILKGNASYCSMM